ncbi:MAG: 3'-5' exonuclease [Eubacterium sp.]|nr:3'-5' exonuclease [Eubacterium sp.]
MSAIGVTVVENNKITDEFYSLVNPEQPFDYFNIRLTGITPQAAADAPTFGELWESKLSALMSGGILVAHNAPFDMSVLAKCLKAYGQQYVRHRNYMCTCQIGRRVLRDLPDHKLNTMCEYLNIDLDHHNAASDSRACAGLLLHYMSLGTDLSRFLKKYDMYEVRTATHK